MTKKQDPEILAICDAMLDKKAKDIKILDVRKLTTLTDYFVICTSESDPQTKAIKVLELLTALLIFSVTQQFLINTDMGVWKKEII